MPTSNGAARSTRAGRGWGRAVVAVVGLLALGVGAQVPLPAARERGASVPAVPTTTPATAWAAMPAAQQRELRARYAAWQALDDAERQRLRQAAATVAALPAAEQHSLRERFDGQDRLYRDGWRLGSQLGAIHPKLHGLFGYLPAEQQMPVLILLRELDAEQRAELVLIAQRTPPQERDALRAQLLAVPAAGRDAWLRQNVGR